MSEGQQQQQQKKKKKRKKKNVRKHNPEWKMMLKTKCRGGHCVGIPLKMKIKSRAVFHCVKISFSVSVVSH